MRNKRISLARDYLTVGYLAAKLVYLLLMIAGVAINYQKVGRDDNLSAALSR